MSDATLTAYADTERAVAAAPVPTPDFQALVGATGWARLHPDIRRRFAHGHATTPVEYAGTMRVERSWMGLAFALVALALGAPLPLRRGDAVDAYVRVAADGRGGVAWDRWLRFEGPETIAHVRSVKRAGPGATLLECVDGGLGIVLRVFEEDGALVFESLGFFLALGSRRVTLPAVLTPGRCRVVHAAVDRYRFSYTMTMLHPLFGLTIRHAGVFDDPEA